MEFSDAEIAYLRGQPLGRLATVAADGQPDAAPVAFRLDDDGTIWIGGRDIPGSRKGKNLAGGNDRVAFVVDDLASVRPWRPRGVRIYGRAELLRENRQFGPGWYIHLVPELSWSWGVEDEPGRGWRPRRTVHGG